MRSLFLLLVLPFAAACSSSSDGPAASPDSGSDAGNTADTSPGPIGDDSGQGGGLDAGGGTETGGTSCSAARDQLLEPVSQVSKGAVTVMSESNGVKTIYIDASAGGTSGESSNPRVYLNLDSGKRVDLTDPAAETSTAWDLAFKRPVIYTNDGDGGPGQGGAALLGAADFDTVTSADAIGVTFGTEAFLDGDCNPNVDAIGEPMTTFSAWYTYNSQQHTLAPEPGTWLVKGATGKIYKLVIVSYYATPDGGTETDGGQFIIKVAAL